MFLLDPDPFAPDATGSKMAGIQFALNVEAAIKNAVDPARIEKFFLTLEKDALNLNTKVANGLKSNLESIQSTIYNVYKEGLDYGFAYGDAKDYIEAIATASQKMVNITTENVKGAVMLSKAMGVGAKEVGAMYASMMQMGIGQEKTRQILEKTFRDARSYGVDASTLTKTVSDNIFKAQAYGFKGGVDGLREMAIQAQRVGISIELAGKAADKAFDPEGAIEMASSLQMLGGNMGGLTDVHNLMYMAQSDIGALQDTILKASSSMVDFNSTTGEFKISPEMKRNMTDQAKAMNMTYDEYAKAAIKFKKEQEVMSRIPLTAGFSEADKSFIASMAEIGPGGEIQIQMPGTDQILKGSDITAKKLEELKIAKEEAEKPIEDIAREQLAVSDKMAKTLEEIKNAGIFGTGLKTGMQIPETINTNLVEKTKNLSETLQTTINSAELGKTLVDSYTTTLTKLNEVISKSTDLILNEIAKVEVKLSKRAKGENEEDESSTPSPSPTPTPLATPTPTPAEDIFMPASKNTVITGSFGSFLPDPKDGILALPENDIDKLFSSYNLFNKMPTERLSPLPMKDLSKAEPIEKYIENKITTENKITNEVNIGGKTELEITLKTPDNNSEKILSLLLSNPELKETVMATINERLSKEYSDKLINVLPG
jgi:hypothetical protein